MKKTGLLFALLLIMSASFAQRANQKWYNNAIGLRVEMNENGLSGLTYDKFVSNQTSVELLVLSDFNTGLEVSGLYKYLKSIPGVPATLRWYIGGGVHAGLFDNGNSSNLTLGPDFIWGIGYTFRDIPLNLCIDYHPVYHLITNDKNHRLYADKFGLSFRYVID